jgi:S-adenosylmethionine decarboxylase proenzyme
VNMSALCQHSLIEFEDCDAMLLKRVRYVRKAMLTAVEAGRGTVVKAVFHEFSPWGVSGVVVITESHVTIHTWPEHAYAAVDILSCSSRLDHGIIVEELKGSLKAGSIRVKSLNRGPGLQAKPDKVDQSKFCDQRPAILSLETKLARNERSVTNV